LGLTYEALYDQVFNSPSAAQATLGQIEEARHWQEVGAALRLPAEDLPALQDAFWGGDRLDTDLIDYIRSLRPRCRTGLLSNAWTTMRYWLEVKWRIADAFDAIIISAEVGLAKPDPRIYRLAVEQLGVAPSEAVFVDDVAENAAGARAAGLQAILFANPQQARAQLDQMLAAE
jgi:epoxide hydrolase-like predicted phosphatase